MAAIDPTFEEDITMLYLNHIRTWGNLKPHQRFGGWFVFLCTPTLLYLYECNHTVPLSDKGPATIYCHSLSARLKIHPHATPL